MEYKVSIPAPVREHRDGVKRGKREQQLGRANPDFAYPTWLLSEITVASLFNVDKRDSLD